MRAGLQLNLKKCCFGAGRLTIPGLFVWVDAVLPYPENLQSVAEFPKPTSIKDLRSFVRLLLLSSFQLKFRIHYNSSDEARE